MYINDFTNSIADRMETSLKLLLFADDVNALFEQNNIRSCMEKRGRLLMRFIDGATKIILF